ncbi:MAG: hypothetical protein K9K86_05715, partial [Pseudomonadales bacterium]|nr:hypothetical protein [Pseudomonadales bacterium]
QLRNNDVQNFYSTITAQRNFLSEHLLRWGHHWSEKVIVSARTEFFRGLGLLTRGSLCELAQVLEMKLPKRLSTPFSTTSLRDADKIKTSRM